VTKIIVATPQRSDERLAEVRARHPETELVVPENRDQVLDLIGDADGFFGSLNAMEFAAAEQLRWVQASSAGVEWLRRVPAIIERDDIVVTNMRGAHAATIAEHLFSYLLTFTRGMREFAEFQQREEWGRGRLAGKLRSIKGMTIGIVGFGNIGRAIARRATGFEMRVLAVDAQQVPPSDGAEEVWPLSRLDEMCREADVLAISAPITPETEGLIGAKQLSQMKHGSYLMAMSRGGIVDEPALIEALQSGQLAAAGLDVTRVEPLPPGDPLWKAPNLIITPHNSAASRLTTDLVWSIFDENLGRFERGETLLNVVDKRLGS
jgi:phosphoglycerate dehydrogenase-like enzyme